MIATFAHVTANEFPAGVALFFAGVVVGVVFSFSLWRARKS